MAKAAVSQRYRTLLSRLKTGRRQAEFTQAEAAKALHRHQSYISKCESGERRIDPVELEEFAKLYRKPISYFLPKS